MIYFYGIFLPIDTGKLIAVGIEFAKYPSFLTWVCICLWTAPLDDKAKPQISQIFLAPPRCNVGLFSDSDWLLCNELTCSFKWEICEKDLWQNWHVWGFSLVWTRWWIINSDLDLHSRPHEHLLGLSSWKVRMCLTWKNKISVSLWWRKNIQN